MFEYSDQGISENGVGAFHGICKCVVFIKPVLAVPDLSCSTEGTSLPFLRAECPIGVNGRGAVPAIGGAVRTRFRRDAITISADFINRASPAVLRASLTILGNRTDAVPASLRRVIAVMTVLRTIDTRLP